MKNTTKVLFIFCSIVLLGCKKLRDQQIWSVKNNSSTTIFVNSVNHFDSEARVDTIVSGEERMIYFLEGMASGQELEDPTMFTTIHINNSSDTLMKDENLKSNWEVSIEKIQKNNDALKYEYDFVVSNLDF